MYFRLWQLWVWKKCIQKSCLCRGIRLKKRQPNLDSLPLETYWLLSHGNRSSYNCKHLTAHNSSSSTILYFSVKRLFIHIVYVICNGLSTNVCALELFSHMEAMEKILKIWIEKKIMAAFYFTKVNFQNLLVKDIIEILIYTWHKFLKEI